MKMMTVSLRVSLALSAVLAGSAAHAMESLDDAALSQQGGQAGMTVSMMLPNSTLSFSQMGVADTDGISGTHLGAAFTGVASMVAAPATYSPTQGLRFFSDPVVNNTPTAQPFLTTIDAGSSAAGAAPVFNMALSMPSDLRRIRINPFSFYLAPAAGSIYNSTRTVLNANVDEVLRVAGNGLDIIFTSDQLTLNMQLGNAPQGHMMAITSGKLLRIGNDATGANPMLALSKNNSGTSSMKLDFELCANAAVVAGVCNTASTAGFSLTNFYAGIMSDAFVFGSTGTTDKLNITFNNLVAGTTGSQASTSFDNLKNASMGSLGLVGVAVTNLQIKMKGL